MEKSPYERWTLIEPLNDGEQEVKDYLRANGYTVADVSDLPEFWKIDVDLLAYKESLEDEVKIEVKNDKVISRTGNLFIELFTDVAKGRAGWFKITQADYIYYRDRENQTVYILPFEQLNQFVSDNEKNLKVVCAPDYRRDGQISKYSSGYVIPIRDYLNVYPETQILHI